MGIMQNPKTSRYRYRKLEYITQKRIKLNIFLLPQFTTSWRLVLLAFGTMESAMSSILAQVSLAAHVIIKTRARVSLENKGGWEGKEQLWPWIWVWTLSNPQDKICFEDACLWYKTDHAKHNISTKGNVTLPFPETVSKRHGWSLQAESGFLYDRKYVHTCWKKRWIGLDWILATKFTVLFHEKTWLERKRIRRKRNC